ncbi:hypothetical protein HDU87_006286 [Geranomyces variabilis]|uniref:Uncharacterized protein n=1 Tax=Geranomyces variabilis TaxID=109894 RepID=A0AAD5XP46_9FUNG|nr:hypothetical protein HDU87_006286 [Geranomyces variabilis]
MSATQEQTTTASPAVDEKPSASRNPFHEQQQHLHQRHFYTVGNGYAQHAPTTTTTAVAAEHEDSSFIRQTALGYCLPSWTAGPSSAPPRGINWPRYDPVRRAKLESDEAVAAATAEASIMMMSSSGYDLGWRPERCSHSRRVSWNAEVAVRETYSADEYDRRVIDVTPVTQADVDEMRAVKDKCTEATRRNSRHGVGRASRGTSTSRGGRAWEASPRPQLPRTAGPPALYALGVVVGGDSGSNGGAVGGLLSDEERRRKVYLPPPRRLRHQQQQPGARALPVPRLNGLPPALQPCF